MANSDSVAKNPKCTRSGGSITDLEKEYPVITHFDKYKLPTHKEVLGLVRKLNELKTYDQTISEVSNSLWNHWTDRNIYPISLKSVKKRVKKEVDEYRNLKNKTSSGRTQVWKDKAKCFIQKKDKLFDIFCEDTDVRKKLEKHHMIPMQEEDFKYLESMRTDRKAICELKTDKKWHEEEIKREQRQKNTFSHNPVIYLQLYLLKMIHHLMETIKYRIYLNLRTVTVLLEKE